MTSRHYGRGLLGLISLLVVLTPTRAAPPGHATTREAPPAPQALPSSAAPPSEAAMATAETFVQQMLTYATTDGGIRNEDDIAAVKRRLEALNLQRRVDPRARRQARAENERGLEAVKNAQWAEAVQAFHAAQQVDPTDIEISNNLGYAYLRQGDIRTAEPWLLRTLVLAPGRTDAWANLGQTYAQQGNFTAAVACLANAYRFSKNRETTRQFFHRLTQDNTEGVRKAAEQALQLQLVQAGAEQEGGGSPRLMAEPKPREPREAGKAGQGTSTAPGKRLTDSPAKRSPGQSEAAQKDPDLEKPSQEFLAKKRQQGSYDWLDAFTPRPQRNEPPPSIQKGLSIPDYTKQIQETAELSFDGNGSGTFTLKTACDVRLKTTSARTIRGWIAADSNPKWSPVITGTGPAGEDNLTMSGGKYLVEVRSQGKTTFTFTCPSKHADPADGGLLRMKIPR